MKRWWWVIIGGVLALVIIIALATHIQSMTYATLLGALRAHDASVQEHGIDAASGLTLNGTDHLLTLHTG